MHRFAPSLLLMALMGTAFCVPVFADGPPTPATHYRWKDSTGVVHFGDTIPSSALAGGYDIVNSQGRLVRHVERELTQAEQRLAAASAARTATARREAQLRQVQDAQLLAAYASDKDLEQSQQAQLQQMNDEIVTLSTNLHSQEDSLTELLAHAADLEHANKPVPPAVNRRISDQRETVNEERNALAQRRIELTRAKLKFAAQLDRYRTLRAKTASTDGPTG